MHLTDDGMLAQVLQFDGSGGQAVGSEGAVAATAKNERTLSGKSVHLRLNEAVETSRIAVGGRHEACALVADQVGCVRA